MNKNKETLREPLVNPSDNDEPLSGKLISVYMSAEELEYIHQGMAALRMFSRSKYLRTAGKLLTDKVLREAK